MIHYIYNVAKKNGIKDDDALIGTYSRNTAEILFKCNLNEEVLVELIDGLRFKGQLLAISCNTIIIQNEEGLTEMFRYEDVRYLQCRR